VTMIGKPAHLAFELTWPASTPTDVTGIGWGSLRLWVGGRLVWSGPQANPVEWSWIDLVEHLARAWGHLEHEQTAPFGITAVHPGRLREGLGQKSVQGVTAIELEDAIHGFQQRHDLAAGLKGLQLEPVWLVREGAMMHLHARDSDLWISFDETVQILTKFVDEVRAQTKVPQARAREAFKDWDKRGASDTLRLRLRTSLSEGERQRR
jgi:hypothetical protein